MTNTTNKTSLPKSILEALRGTSGWVKKANETIVLDVDSLTIEGLRYLVEYGFKQSLNDSVASVDKSATSEAANLANKRHTAILRGAVGQGGGGTNPLDKQIRAVLAERISGWKDFSAAAKKQTISKIAAGEGNEASQAILAEAERRIEAKNEASVEDLGL